MTEAEWNGCEDPTAMLLFLRGIGKVSDRKVRLFSAACCRRYPHLPAVPDIGQSINALEQYVDGRLRDTEYLRADPWTHCGYVCNMWTPCAWDGAYGISVWVIADSDDAEAERTHQVALLRCVFGNPFRPPPPAKPSLLTWNDRTVMRIAQAIYEGRRYGDMPILADALEEAGSANPDILEHCRSAGEHVRGCWVLDLLLQKE